APPLRGTCARSGRGRSRAAPRRPRWWAGRDGRRWACRGRSSGRPAATARGGRRVALADDHRAEIHVPERRPDRFGEVAQGDEPVAVALDRQLRQRAGGRAEGGDGTVEDVEGRLV